MIKPKTCPKCGRPHVNVWRILGTRKYTVECVSCHWFGKTRLFRWRAIRAWNKEKSQWLRVNT